MNIEQFTSSDVPGRIYKFHEGKKEDWRRPHLGASMIGRDCLREIWYSFRWYKKPSFDGRMLRLFETGQMAEDRIVAELQGIGVRVTDRQKRVQILPHFSGSIDGLGIGFTESNAVHLLEFKTHNAKSWALLNKGVKASKPAHYVQMMTYMGGMGLTRAYYIAVNKDTDEIYAERVRYDHDVFIATKMKAHEIIMLPTPPDRIAPNPARFECRFCEYKEICHGAEGAEKNCRTCRHIQVTDEGFECTKHGGLVPVDFQREGCYGWEC